MKFRHFLTKPVSTLYSLKCPVVYSKLAIRINEIKTMKKIGLILIYSCVYSLSLFCKEVPDKSIAVNAADIFDLLLISSDSISKEREYMILYPSSIDKHIVIKQFKQEKMHIRLMNIGGQVLREQWTEALETDLNVKNLKGLFIVEIKYEGGVFSKTILINS